MKLTASQSRNISILLALLLVSSLHLILKTSNGVESKTKWLSQKLVFNNKIHRKQRVKGRNEYFNLLMRDPKTGFIPPMARVHELEWKKKSQLFKSSTDKFDWSQAGPYTVGGRTRTLKFDFQNSNTIVTGGISGGIWKTKDKGLTWYLTTPDFQNMNVTDIAQDKRDGHLDTWYAVTGEFDGNSAGYPASGFRGYGIFKSTDYAESWQLLSGARNPNITTWNSAYDYMSKVVVNPTNGDVYVASHAGVLLKSTNGGDSWETAFGEFGSFQYVDVEINASGRIIASLSGEGFDDDAAMPNPGIYYSDNDGSTWNNITPSDFPTTFYRTVLRIPKDNPDILYTLTQGEGKNVYLYKINHKDNTFENRSEFIPVFAGKTADYFNTQGSYDMVLEVDPIDENFVVIGGVNLFRSANGFATKQFAGTTPTATELSKIWIGGYTKNNDSYANYLNHHADQHVFVFDPSTPNAAWSGHDGGITYTSNIYGSTVSWINRNQGYYVTQFYHIYLSRVNGQRTVIGGAQDNGSPIFDVGSSESDDASTGDGAYAYLGENRMYASSQLGTLQRYVLNTNNQFSYAGEITPENAENQLFIHPYEVDKNNSEIIYYPSGEGIFRTIDGGQFGTQSWADLRSTIKTRTGMTITALATSVNPLNILYFAGSDNRQNASLPPYIYRLSNASTATNSTNLKELTLPNAPNGAYVSSIAVNPENADEVLVTLSNYNVEGIFYTSNGSTFTQVEGNLRGASGTPGPSIRSAAITKVNGIKVFLVGTTTGVYSTTTLDGNNTIWIEEGKDVIGNSLVSSLSYRETDSHIAIGTHGRGAFYGTPSGSTVPIPDAVTLLTPTTNSIDVPTKPTLTWSESENASTYTVQLSKFADFSAQITELTDITTNSVTLSNHLNIFSTYYWRVRAENTSGRSLWSLISSFTTNAPAPELLFPTQDQTDVSIAPTFSWNSIQSGATFEFQIEANAINGFHGNFYVSVVDASLSLNGLYGFTRYHWRVRYKMDEGTSDWSEVFSFITRKDPIDIEVNVLPVSFDFGDTSSGSGSPDVYDYQLVSIPGKKAVPLNEVFTGEYNSTWRAFLENGAATNNYDEYSEGDTRFQFKTGNGFWVLSTSPVDLSVAVTPVDVNDNDVVEIPIEPGWNVISNPFQHDLSWTTIQTANSLSANLWDYSNTSGVFEKSLMMKSLKAYYFYNQPFWNKSTLLIPYTTEAQSGKNPFVPTQIPENTPQIMLTADFGDDVVTNVNWIFGTNSTELESFETNHPNLSMVKQGAVISEMNAESITYEQLSDEYIQSGKQYALQLKGKAYSKVQLKAAFSNLENSARILLVNRVTKSQVLLSNNSSVEVELTEPNVHFDAYIGDDQYLTEVSHTFIPEQYSLSQNYPNPFNPSTTIRYSIPEQSHILLQVFDIAGRLVQTVVNQSQQTGWYSVRFDATNLSSGTYIYRLQAGNRVFTNKMILVK